MRLLERCMTILAFVSPLGCVYMLLTSSKTHFRTGYINPIKHLNHYFHHHRLLVPLENLANVAKRKLVASGNWKGLYFYLFVAWPF
jgi:hypothetical protein